MVVVEMYVRGRQNGSSRRVLCFSQFFGEMGNMMIIDERQGAHDRFVRIDNLLEQGLTDKVTNGL